MKITAIQQDAGFSFNNLEFLKRPKP